MPKVGFIFSFNALFIPFSEFYNCLLFNFRKNLLTCTAEIGAARVCDVKASAVSVAVNAAVHTLSCG